MTYNFASFNPEDHPDDFEPVPVGKYPTIITSAQMKNTKDNAGQFLEVQYQITGDHNPGMILIDRLNLINMNATAVQIAEKTLAKLIKACGLVGISGEADLLNKTPMLDIGIIPGEPYTDQTTGEVKQGFAQNSIKYMIPVSQAPAQQMQQQPQQTAMQQAEQALSQPAMIQANVAPAQAQQMAQPLTQQQPAQQQQQMPSTPGWKQQA